MRLSEFEVADEHGRKLDGRARSERGDEVNARPAAQAEGLNGESGAGFQGAEKCLVSKLEPKQVELF